MFARMIRTIFGGRRMPTAAAGKTAPTFELANTEGKPYTLTRALAKGPVLAAFFKVGCPTCQFTFPFVERLYQLFRDKGVQVWGISQDNASDSQRFAKQFGVTFPILIDGDHYATSLAYGFKTVPTLFLIAPDGHVEKTSDGFCKADLLEIQKLLAKHLSAASGELFKPTEKIPEFKPG